MNYNARIESSYNRGISRRCSSPSDQRMTKEGERQTFVRNAIVHKSEVKPY